MRVEQLILVYDLELDLKDIPPRAFKGDLSVSFVALHRDSASAAELRETCSGYPCLIAATPAGFQTLLDSTVLTACRHRTELLQQRMIESVHRRGLEIA